MKIIQLFCVLLTLVLSGVATAQQLRAGVLELANKLSADAHRTDSSKISLLSLYLTENYDQQSLHQLITQFQLAPANDAAQRVALNRNRYLCEQLRKSSTPGYSVSGAQAKKVARQQLSSAGVCERARQQSDTDQSLSPGDIRALAKAILTSG